LFEGKSIAKLEKTKIYYFKNVLHNVIYLLFVFSGLAGIIYFLLDMQQPHLAKFPAYDI